MDSGAPPICEVRGVVVEKDRKEGRRNDGTEKEGEEAIIISVRRDGNGGGVGNPTNRHRACNERETHDPRRFIVWQIGDSVCKVPDGLDEPFCKDVQVMMAVPIKAKNGQAI